MSTSCIVDIKHSLLIRPHSVQCQSLTGMNYQIDKNEKSVTLYYIACTEEQRYVGFFLMVINGVGIVGASQNKLVVLTTEWLPWLQTS